ncbi:hypothetical protein [Pseudoalteromonas sp. JC28]|uniref:hypothetical protein n=1 Tax=Pseudoalteromonas sp. JC28 TaxID=2267617 RepID=UPI001572B314|nr:hypothetical protein [Pseudoalteromonas sp. JC28]
MTQYKLNQKSILGLLRSSDLNADAALCGEYTPSDIQADMPKKTANANNRRDTLIEK